MLTESRHDRPIIFSGEMVREIQAGRKTQTRRIVKPQPPSDNGTGRWTFCVDSTERKHRDTWTFREVCPDGDTHTERGRERELWRGRCPYGMPGDQLWVKENFRLRLDEDHCPPADSWSAKIGSAPWYEADGPWSPSGCAGGAGKLRPSIFMPRWASRLTLEITFVRIERLQEITESGARAEGVSCRAEFVRLWDTINGKRAPWASNPWLWVVGFRK